MVPSGGATGWLTWFQQQASSGSLLLAIPVALVAGLVSFFSPCVLPLVPGYLSYVTGLSGADLEHARRGRMLAGVVLFVLGFSVVFVAARLRCPARSAPGSSTGGTSSRSCSASSPSCSAWRSSG